MTQALTNVLLIDAVTGCLQNQRSITAASKLAYFDKIRQEGLGSEFVVFFTVSVKLCNFDKRKNK